MDLRRLRVGEWITAIAGIVLLVSLFLPWMEIADGSGAGHSGWETLAAVDVLLAILGLWALAVWAITAAAPSTAPGIASQTLLVPFALVMSIVILIKVWGYDYGAWIALAGTLGVLVGVLVAMRDERLSSPGRPTDATGVPVAAPPTVEKLSGPPPA